jgi:hypothetical protein
MCLKTVNTNWLHGSAAAPEIAKHSSLAPMGTGVANVHNADGHYGHVLIVYTYMYSVANISASTRRQAPSQSCGCLLHSWSLVLQGLQNGLSMLSVHNLQVVVHSAQSPRQRFPVIEDFPQSRGRLHTITGTTCGAYRSGAKY